MFKSVVTPRFAETDALGHLGNTALPVWFEEARGPVFELFNPELDIKEEAHHLSPIVWTAFYTVLRHY